LLIVPVISFFRKGGLYASMTGPMEISSKKPVTRFRQVIEVKKLVSRYHSLEFLHSTQDRKYEIHGSYQLLESLGLKFSIKTINF